MKQMFLFLFILLSVSVFCQTKFSISGIIYDDNHKAIEIADVLLLSKENKKILKYTFVENGKFFFNNIKKGSYYIKISSLSYSDVLKEINITKNLQLEYSVNHKNEILNEVKITGHKKLIKNKKGNLHIAIENSILSKEPSIIHLLSKLPKLQVNEAQETIEIIGKGTPLIYIDNQQVSFQTLSSLQVDEIQNIEIINNPSSKYEANATSVLHITLKKNKSDGFKILLKETASLKNYFNNYLSSYVNLKKGHFEGKLSIAYNHINVWESNGAFYEIADKNITSNYLVKAITNRKQAIMNGGFYYQINKNDYISINSNIQNRKEPFSINTTTNYIQDNTYDFIDTKSTDFSTQLFTNSTLNYQKQIKNTSKLFFASQYSFYQQQITNNITNTIGNAISTINRLQDFSIDSYNFKINYEKKLTENKLLEIGTNYSETNTLTDNESISYRFIEKNKAMYGQFSNELTNKLSYSIGIRVEENAATGYFTNSNTNEYHSKKTQLFPKVNVYYPFKPNQSLTLNYSKSINRPNFSSLSNTSAFINPYLEFTGNLNLTNAIINELSLNYQFSKKAITFKYNYTTNPIRPYTFNYDVENEKTVVQPLNLIDGVNISLETSIPFKYKFWSSENIISFIYSNIKDTRAIKTHLQSYIYYYSNHIMSINDSTSFNINLWGSTLRGEGAFITKPIFTINTSIQKKLKNLDITLSYNDIFNSLKFGERYTLENIKVDNQFFIDANEISLSLKYNLRKIAKSNYKNKTIGNSNRIK